MANKKNGKEPEMPMLFEEEETYYKAAYGKKILGGKNEIRATENKILVLSGSGYKSIFYDKIVSVNVKKFRTLEISLVGGKEPETFFLNRRDALGLAEIVSRMASLSSDARMAYAIGTIEAQKRIREERREAVQEVGARRVMEYVSEETRGKKETEAKQNIVAYAEEYSKKHMVSVSAKNSEGRELDISFNFIPKIKDSVYRLGSEALYTLTHGIYSRSSLVAGILYGNAKNAGVGISATIASTIKQNFKEEFAKNAYAMAYVALENIFFAVALEGDSMAYASPNCLGFADLSIEEFTHNIYHELGDKLVGAHMEAIASGDKQNAEMVVSPVGANLLRTGHDESGSIEAIKIRDGAEHALDTHKQEVAKRILENSIIFNARALNEKKNKEKKIIRVFHI